VLNAQTDPLVAHVTPIISELSMVQTVYVTSIIMMTCPTVRAKHALTTAVLAFKPWFAHNATLVTIVC
jgi:hypothetical protein